MTTSLLNLPSVNPLIASEKWDEDTASNVRGALEFIADAISNINQSGGLNESTAYGASRLILCCVAAMEVTKGAVGQQPTLNATDFKGVNHGVM